MLSNILFFAKHYSIGYVKFYTFLFFNIFYIYKGLIRSELAVNRSVIILL